MSEQTKLDRLVDWLRGPPPGLRESLIADAFEELRDKQRITVLALDHLAGPGGTESDLRLRIELLEKRLESLERR